MTNKSLLVKKVTTQLQSIVGHNVIVPNFNVP